MQSLITRVSLAALLVLSLVLIPGISPFQPQSVHATLGGYQSVSYSSSNFGATGSMTFTNVTQNTYRYIIDTSNQMHLMVDLLNSNIGGTTTSAFLTVKIPEGRQSANTIQFPALIAYNNGSDGVWEAAYVIASAGSNSLLIRRASGANFTTVTGTFRLNINTMLEVSEAP